jgi:hypothetical protein
MTRRTRVIDLRAGNCKPAGTVEMPTFSIPPDCACSWTVVRAGVGMACVSRLTHISALCPAQRQHQPPEVTG